MPHAVVAAPLLLAAVLALSGVAKLRDDTKSTQSVMVLLRLPAWLLKPWTATSLPWGELVLAALLVLAPKGAAMWVAAVGALLLTGAYWGVVARAMTFDPRPTCGCFGRIGDQQIAAKTLWRNTILLALAVLTVVVAARGESTWSLLTSGVGVGQTWWWLLALAVVSVMVTLVVSGSGQGAGTDAVRVPAAPARAGGDAQDAEDYDRQPIPLASLTDPDGHQHTLVEMSRERAQLLVFVNCYCASSGTAFEAMPRWQAQLPGIDVRFVFSVPVHKLAVAGGQLDTSSAWRDHGGVAWHALAFTTSSPTAILLGADGLLAGGPVTGNADVEEFVADIAEALSGSMPSSEAQRPVSDQASSEAEPSSLSSQSP
ncbi:MAG: MauE/DoxX family redox-associated membrane protein [Nostocoides sp.]